LIAVFVSIFQNEIFHRAPLITVSEVYCLCNVSSVQFWFSCDRTKPWCRTRRDCENDQRRRRKMTH